MESHITSKGVFWRLCLKFFEKNDYFHKSGGGRMADIKGLEWTFDTVAPIYEKVRPGYVDELYQTIFDYIPIHESSNVIEIGIGGGQATLPVLKTGCKFTAVEHGENFSKRAEKNSETIRISQ